MRIRRCQKLFAVLLLSGGVIAHAGTYRWVDENGQVHYTDRKQGAQTQGIKPYATPGAAQAAPGERMEKTRRLLNAYRLEREQKREQKAAQKAAQEKRKKSCNRARDDVRRYNTYRRVYRLDDDGNRVYLSDQERTDLLQRSQEKVARWCG
ncbi:MAG: DUF4124 domain-containing protein [Thiogranum sp.]